MWLGLFVPEVSAQTFDFDEGIKVLTEGLISVKKEALRDKKIAVFGIIESKSRKRWDISSHIEDGIVDVLVNEGYTVIERRRIEDIIKEGTKVVAFRESYPTESTTSLKELSRARTRQTHW